MCHDNKQLRKLLDHIFMIGRHPTLILHQTAKTTLGPTPRTMHYFHSMNLELRLDDMILDSLETFYDLEVII